MSKKICSKCRRELPLECFNKCKSKKDGLQVYCKECLKQYYADNSEAIKERQKQYNADNAERLKQYIKQWRADNAERIKQYYADNAEHFKQYSKQRYATIEGYAYQIRYKNLREDRKYGRIAANEDPLPTIEQYIELLQQRDFYDKKQYHWSEMGLDRIYNDKPHTFANVVPCSTANNKRRGTMPFEEFCKLMKKEKQRA